MSSYKDIGPSQYNIYKNGKVIHVINDVCEEDYDFSGTYEIEINTYGEKGVLADILSGLNGEDFYIERVSYKKSNDSDEVIKKTDKSPKSRPPNGGRRILQKNGSKSHKNAPATGFSYRNTRYTAVFRRNVTNVKQCEICVIRC